MDTIYDVIIIGSGLGGLECATILSKHGYNVCVLEKNSKLGGTLQGFKRNGCEYGTGMHYIGSLDKGQITHKIFRYLGISDKIKVKRMDPNGFDVFNIAGKEYKYAGILKCYNFFVEDKICTQPDILKLFFIWAESSSIRNYLVSLYFPILLVKDNRSGMELTSIYEVKSLAILDHEIKARIAFNKDHMVFAGHFPDNPVVPGVVQIQILKDLLENALNENVLLNRTKSIKFLNIISPVEVEAVQFEIAYEQQSENNLTVKCIVKSGSQIYMKYSGNAMILTNE